MNNKFLKFSQALLLFPLPLAGCTNYQKIDYSKVANWYKCDHSIGKEVDCFFVYPTISEKGDENGVTTIEDAKKDIKYIYESQASVFSKYCNVYIPFYRQISLTKVEQLGTSNKGYRDYVYNAQTYADICNALDYYFENFNNNKPFILAGHSQGSAILNVVLQHYMQEHSEYLSRLIAVYSIGFAPSISEYSKFTNIKLATGESDAGGVIISWNSFGPNHARESILMPDDPYCINPLNWKTDNTPADLSLNIGSRALKEDGAFGKVDGFADATIQNGYIVVNPAFFNNYLTDVDDLFGTESLHLYDYQLFYYNLQENVGKRINTFLSK